MSATEPSRRITARWVPLSGSQAKTGLPRIARVRLAVSGNTGNTTCSSVTMKSCIMLAKGALKRSDRVSAPAASTVW